MDDIGISEAVLTASDEAPSNRSSRSSSIDILTRTDEESDVEVLSIMDSADDHPLIVPASYKTYKRRWYILAIFSLMALHQCLVWNTFGPIDRAVRYAYEWDDATVAMMANWGTIMFVIGVVPLSWFLQVQGLRKTVIFVTSLIAVGTSLRCFSKDDLVFTIMSHLCAILNGLSGVTVMAAPPAISAAWFSPSERTTATSINIVMNGLGNAVAFTLGPYLVPDKNISLNDSSRYLELYTRDEVKQYIEWYMVGMAVASGVLLFAIVGYFPDKPPSPPSATSTLPRTDFIKGVKDLSKNGNIWLCTIGYALPSGLTSAWQAVMVLNFSPLGVSETEVGFIGFVATVVYCGVSPIIAALMDRVKKHLKSTLVFLCVVSTICFVWLWLLCIQVIPYSLVQLYLSVILGNLFVGAAGILFFEYTVELAFPVPEGVVGAFITCFNNLLGVLFYSVFFIKSIKSFVWINYVLVAACLISIPATAFTQATYRRLDVDEPDSRRSSPDSFQEVNDSPHLQNPVLDDRLETGSKNDVSILPDEV